MYVSIERQGPLALWTIHRPERRNALGTLIAAELFEAAQSLKRDLENADSAPQALAITAIPTASALGKIWIAGGDLKELSAFTTPEAARGYATTMSELCQRLEDLPIPVIIAIDGAAIGGGAELALAGDIRLATNDSLLDFKQLQIGLATGYGGTLRLVELVGASRASAWLLLSQSISARTALEAGLFSELAVDRSSLLARVAFLAQHFASLPRASVAAQKAMLLDHGPERRARLARECEHFLPLWGNPHHREVLMRYSK